jgi:hypothetical protein
MGYNRKPVETLVTDIPDIAVSFDADAFDVAIRAHGVELIHYSALRCPVGMTDIGDNRRPHEDHAGCSNGFIYTKSGCVASLFTSNGNSAQLRDIGFVDGASVVVTFPRTYQDFETPFYLAPFDRFYLNEDAILVPTWQLAICNESGQERLSFPVEVVESLVDSRGDLYRLGENFCIRNGQICWLEGAKRPMKDLETGRGAVISVRYRYRPFWVCARLLHEIRVAQIESPINNDRSIVRMPQQALLNREFLYLNESADGEAIRNPKNPSSGPNSPRQTPGPDDGGFGPR